MLLAGTSLQLPLAVLFRHCLSRSGAAAQLQRQVSNLKNEEPMRKHLLRVLMVAALTGGLALAQATSPQSTSPSAGQQSTTSPTQTQPATPGQAGTTPSASLTQAQSQVQDALSKQMPSSGVSVSINSKNQLELTGTVSSESDKQRAEDVARSAAAGQTIINKIKVSGSSSDLNKPK